AGSLGHEQRAIAAPGELGIAARIKRTDPTERGSTADLAERLDERALLLGRGVGRVPAREQGLGRVLTTELAEREDRSSPHARRWIASARHELVSRDAVTLAGVLAKRRDEACVPAIIERARRAPAHDRGTSRFAEVTEGGRRARSGGLVAAHHELDE